MIKRQNRGQLMIESLLVVGLIFGSLFLFFRLTENAMRDLRQGCRSFEQERNEMAGLSKTLRSSCGLGLRAEALDRD